MSKFVLMKEAAALGSPQKGSLNTCMGYLFDKIIICQNIFTKFIK